MTTKQEEDFIRAVAVALDKKGWVVSDDGTIGVQADIIKSEFADAIIKNLHILK